MDFRRPRAFGFCRQWKATEIFEQGSDIAAKFIFLKFVVSKRI